MPRRDLIQLRGGAAADWAAANPVLAEREPGVELDTGRMKFGDGEAAWVDLPYTGEVGGGGGGADPGAMWAMSRSVQQIIPAVGFTTVEFDLVNIDRGEDVIDLENNRFVVPTDGFYLAIPHWRWSTAPAATATLAARVNGANVAPTLTMYTATAPAANRDLTGVVPLALVAGAFVTMVVTPGGATDAIGNAGNPHLRTTFTLTRVGVA